MAEKIERYRGRIQTIYIFFFSVFGFILAAGMVTSVLARAKRPLDFSELGWIFSFFWLAIIVLIFAIGLYGIISTKIVVFNDGIELRNITNKKRCKLLWSAIEKVQFQEGLFGDGNFVLNTYDSNVQGIIPFPLKNMDKFINSLRLQLGNDHLLIKEILKKT